MNEYELREVTRLVGESLVDLDVEDGSDVIVVAGELVDAQDFMLDFDDGGCLLYTSPSPRDRG